MQYHNVVGSFFDNTWAIMPEAMPKIVQAVNRWSIGMKLDKEVFSKKEFKDYAKQNLVLVEVDFPNAKRQTKKLKEQNEKLKAEHSVKGFPTIIVLNSEGQTVGELGYMPGGPAPFLEKLDALKGKAATTATTN